MMETALQFASSSADYYTFISQSFDNEESIISKATGRFYTHQSICRTIAASVIRLSTDLFTQQRISIIDPFCGDGRLVVALLERLLSGSYLLPTTHIEVTLWDIDAKGVEIAEKAVNDLLSKQDRSFLVRTTIGDTFLEFAKSPARYDICVTNPPWCLLKPTNYSKFTRLSQETISRYEIVAEEYGNTLKRLFPSAMPAKTFGRWGINLSRCGLDACMSLLKEHGICGIVMPATLFSDQVSTALRKKLYEENRIHEIHYYPAEVKLFGDADQTSIAVVFSAGQVTTTFNIWDYSELGRLNPVVFGEKYQRYTIDNDYTIPFGYSLETIEILSKLAKFPKLTEYPGLWIGREIDETRISDRLVSQGKYAFKKGYMVNRYSCEDDLHRFLIEDITVPDTVMRPKIVWRDVSRATQKRRIKATLLPEGTIAGNSLGVISLSSGSDNHLYWLLALLNSYVVEFYARRRLITNHVPAGVLRDISMPVLDESSEVDASICQKAKAQINNPQNVVRDAELECLAAKVYGLTLEEFLSVLAVFKVSVDEEQLLRSTAEKVWQMGVLR